MSSFSKKWIKIVVVVVLLAAVFFLGYAVAPGDSGKGAQTSEKEPSKKAQKFTCSMHPQIQENKMGKCPLCGMDLIPVATDDLGDDGSPRMLKLTPRARKLAAVQLAPVERKFVSTEVRMVGKIEFDETRLSHITAWVPGRLDRLFVDYTGIQVNKGDHLVSLYSPDLYSAQEELLQALRTVEELQQSEISIIKETAQETVEDTREKLRLWGLTREQIQAIEERGEPADHMTIFSPISGIVIHKHAVEGMYVKTGNQVYTIADLSSVWAKLDAYESDLMWIRYGQEVEFQTEAYPGETFKGKIAFIDPVLDSKTRTVKVRVNVPNLDGKLKPEMFVRALVRSRIAAGGRVMDPDMAGKWMCPMHPEIVHDGPASCDLCEMPIVRAETLGYVAVAEEEGEAPLVIPATAPLITGKRAIVYVAVQEEEGMYEGREIVLGPRAGEYYLVAEGLSEGERVVVNGNFKIDSALQLLAKPSMMNPEGGGALPGHDHGMEGHAAESKHEKAKLTPFEVPKEFRIQLDPVFSAYFQIQQALSQDDHSKAVEESRKLLEKVEAVNMGLLAGEVHMKWMRELEGIKKSAGSLSASDDMVQAREAFFLLSEVLYVVSKRFGTGGREPVLRFYCPMAFNNRGGHWLQNKEGVENPYFGAAMFLCGEQVETVVSGMSKEEGDEGHHE